MTSNFLQVGRAIKCGHCHPEKYAEGLKQAEAAIPNYVCECKCHDLEKIEREVEEIKYEEPQKVENIWRNKGLDEALSIIRKYK